MGVSADCGGGKEGGAVQVHREGKLLHEHKSKESERGARRNGIGGGDVDCDSADSYEKYCKILSSFFFYINRLSVGEERTDGRSEHGTARTRKVCQSEKQHMGRPTWPTRFCLFVPPL